MEVIASDQNSCIIDSVNIVFLNRRLICITYTKKKSDVFDTISSSICRSLYRFVFLWETEVIN